VVWPRETNLSMPLRQRIKSPKSKYNGVQPSRTENLQEEQSSTVNWRIIAGILLFTCVVIMYLQQC